MKVLVGFVTCFFIVDGFGFSLSNSSRLKRNITKCKASEEICRSGECISQEYFCDGNEDCSDGSDETSCESVPCPAYAFRCAYGACISSVLRCDGVKNCRDNSDENSCGISRRKRSPIILQSSPESATRDSCTLPQYPEHGKWIALHSETLRPGDVVGVNSVIAFTCEKNYKLMPDVTLSLCLPDWTIVPECLKRCPPLPTSETLNVTCSIDLRAISCENPVEGTTATMKCDGLKNALSAHCRNGSWDNSLESCKPGCGKIPDNTENVIVNGIEVNRTKFPWNVAIYRDDEYFCGGSLISQNIVITAGHCITTKNKDVYTVGAGKNYNILNDSRDDLAQFSKVANLYIHEDFVERPFYAFDMGILVLETAFQLTDYTLPVCLDTSDNDLSTLVGRVGTIGGYGTLLNDYVESYDMKYLEVDYKSRKTCELPKGFRRFYYPRDKICFRVQNTGEHACKGISGSGIVFPDDTGKYVLWGITSIAPPDCGNVNSSRIILGTSIKEYMPFIQEIQTKHNI